MDWFPLLNSLRIAALSTAIVFFPGLLAARYVMKIPPSLSRIFWDAAFTLPLVLPPPVIGWLILQAFGPRHMLGYWVRQLFDIRLVMTWPAAALAAAIVAFPIMYRVARYAFERFDPDIADAARTLGRPETWIFWNVQVPVCGRGVVAATLLAFARALGEYGASVMAAGYAPGGSPTVASAVYGFWSRGDNASALIWVLLSVLLSGACLCVVGAMEQTGKEV